MKRILWTVGTSALLGGIGLWCAAEPAPAPENDASSRSLEGATLDLLHQYSGTWQMIDNGFALEHDHAPLRFGMLLQCGTYVESESGFTGRGAHEGEAPDAKLAGAEGKGRGDDPVTMTFTRIDIHGTRSGRPYVTTLGEDDFVWINAWEWDSTNPLHPEEAERLGPFVPHAAEAWDADGQRIPSGDLRRRSLHGSMEVRHLLTCWFADRTCDIQVLEHLHGVDEGVRYLFSLENDLRLRSYGRSGQQFVWDQRDYGRVSRIVVHPPEIINNKIHGGLHDPPPGGGSTGGG